MSRITLTSEARKAISESIENLRGETFSNALGWEFIELCASAFLDHMTLVSWDGMHDEMLTADDDEWEIVRLRDTVTSVEDVERIVLSNAVR